MGGTIVNMPSVRTAVAGVTTVALAAAAAYLAVILLFATGEAVEYVLDDDRYGTAAFLLLVGGAVFAGAAAVTWIARRDGHSWWRAVRRASLVLILGTYAVGVIYLMVSGPF